MSDGNVGHGGYKELVLGLLRTNSGRYWERNSYDRSTSNFPTIQSNLHFTLQCLHYSLVQVSNLTVPPIPTKSPKARRPQYIPILLWERTCLRMITPSEGDARMGLECRREKVPIKISWCVSVKMREERKESTYRQVEPTKPLSNTGRRGISSSLPHWFAGLMTGLNDYLDYTKGGGYRKQQSKSQLGTYGSTQLHRDQFTAGKDFQYNLQQPHWT